METDLKADKYDIKNTSHPWIATLIFCTSLGIFGAHRFYNRKTGSAIAMLLVTILTFGFGLVVTAIWAFIDWINIVAGNFTDENNDKLTVKF